jgi:hypothetical protein
MSDFDTRMIALAASAAFDVVDAGTEAAPDTLDDITETGGSFIVPVLIPTDVETGDGRKFQPGSLSMRDLPLPLLWQTSTNAGHDGSVIVGRIDSIDELDGGGYGMARGVFDTGPYGREAERLVRGKFLRGISADLDKFEANVEDEDDALLAADGDEEGQELPAGEKIKNEKITVSKARVTAATLVPKPAFQEAYIVMEDEYNAANAESELVPDGVYSSEEDDLDTELAALAASAAPVAPPKSWFENPSLDRPTPLTIDDDGRVFGHIAAWHVQHIGLPRAQKPPRSASRYAYFQTGMLRTEEGEDVNVGQLTLSGGHAPMQADAALAVKHYDDTASAVADVCAGEDAHGIWVAGSLRPGVTPEQVRVLRASAPSGDWRPINGRLELVAVCQVNVPGFPVARAMVASGQVTALVAAGAAYMAELREQPMRALEERLERVERQTERVLSVEQRAAAARLAQLREDRRAQLALAAAAARGRLKPLEEKRSALLSSAEDARSRITALKTSASGFHAVPEFKEAQHPRDDEGKFRQVLARLTDALQPIDGAQGVTDDLAKAADAEDAGDNDAANSAAQSAKARLDDLRNNTDDPKAQQRIEQAQSMLQSVIGATNDALDSASEGNGPVDAVINYLLNAIVSQVDPTQAIRNAPEQVARQLAGRQFRSVQDLVSYIQELIRRQVSPV